MPTHITHFGTTPQGQQINLYALQNAHGLIVKIIDYGTRITELHTPDRTGRLANIVQGFDNLPQYLADRTYQGATIGRYANRIALGQFSLDGKNYNLPISNAPNSLHGGDRGFDAIVWQIQPLDDNTIQARHLSRDGEEGYPGHLAATVTISLNDQNELRMDFEAMTDQPTPVNMTNHSYFNLAGVGTGSILDHELTIHADRYTVVDKTLIPTGELAPVKGTPFDFTSPHTVGQRIAQTAGGYDHNYVLRSQGKLSSAAVLRDPSTSRSMEILTTQPGIQFYSGNFLNESMRGIGGPFTKHGALCLETQHFPDSPNRPHFPTTILRPGATYHETVVYRFTSL
ncbi:MAG TPA: aldose epimerase family protein [Tepidisphaeraceae bacterium]|jgi:aldose 1-epimerase|nr:aldose epimerase family protein [Tepidisphaeraceae bacterium]